MNEFFVSVTMNGVTTVGVDRFNQEDGHQAVHNLYSSLEAAGLYTAVVCLVPSE